MFWKKSHNKGENSENLFNNPEDNRSSYRVAPSPHAPLKVTLKKEEVSVIDVSSGGVCLKSNNFKAGDIYPFQLSLPDEDEKITASIEILQIDDNNHCRCQFLDLAPKYEDQIHRYVLNRQKEDLVNYK